ncbi:MAG: hypothetical protein NZ956_00015 [Candidatus Caldarchaeum sp.]|nr:hypothetical protein [Candidatus Caldarchaeum sp.]
MKRREIVEQLFEVLMSSVNSNAVPPQLGWRVFEKFYSQEIYDDEGFRLLVKACRLCEPEKTALALKGVFK